MNEFVGKKYLVTGASSGIGKELAILLSNAGAKVVLLGRDENRLIQTLKSLNGIGHSYISYDLDKLDGLQDVVVKASSGGKLDGFVHCAGVHGVCPIRLLDYDKFMHIFRINALSYIGIVKHFVKKQNSNDGASVVFVSSTQTKNHSSGQLAYALSKGAIETIQKDLSREFLRRKIRFNSVLVSYVRTNMIEQTEHFAQMRKDGLESLSRDVFKGISAQEVCNMIMFLLGESAKFIVGENYFIDGGDFQ